MPPALQRMSGMMNAPLALRISSAAGVSGAFAPSAISLARNAVGVLLGDGRAAGRRNQARLAIGFRTRRRAERLHRPQSPSHCRLRRVGERSFGMSRPCLQKVAPSMSETATEQYERNQVTRT